MQSGKSILNSSAVLFSATSLRGEQPPAKELPLDLCSSSKAFHSTNIVHESVLT